MFFIFISIIVPTVVYFGLPHIVERIGGKRAVSKDLLIVACFLFFISWYLPSPLIQGENTAFTTHFVGGGMFSGLLWFYIRKHLSIKLSLLQDLLAIYTLASALGVANELFELAVSQFSIVDLEPFDTWWDLLANTLGAVLVWGVYSIYKFWNTQEKT